MDDHGEQPGPTPGGGAGRSENLQGGGQVGDHMDGHGGQPGPNPGGGAGRSENLQGGSRERLQGEPALQGGHGSTGVTRLSLLYRLDLTDPQLQVGAGARPSHGARRTHRTTCPIV